MEYPGTVRDAAARKYAGFTYRKPITATVDIWQLDPERLHQAHEYPRSVNPPSEPNLPSVELADYVVEIGAPDSGGLSPLQLWMKPNKHTAARVPLLVCEFSVANAFTLRHQYRDEALRRAFGVDRTGPSRRHTPEW